MDKFENLENTEPISIQAKTAINNLQNSFFLSANLLTNEEVIKLSEILKKSVIEIEAFEITFNSCDQDCFKAFNFLDKINKTFIINGPIDNNGIKNLFTNQAKVKFRELTLTKTKISFDGLNVLQLFLLSNGCITALDISENGLNDVDGDMIVNILKATSSLTEIWLKRNKFSKIGVVKILDALKGQICIEYIDLSFQSEDCTDLIERYRQENDMINIDYFNETD